PRVSIVVSSTGSPLPRNKTITWKGLCRVTDDGETKRWFYPELAAALHDDPARQAAFVTFLDTPRRVVLEVEPSQRIGFDGSKMRRATDEWIASASASA